MRDVLEQMSAVAARSIIDSTYPRKKRAQQKAASVAAKTREHKFFSGNYPSFRSLSLRNHF